MLSPILWLIYVNDITLECPKSVECSLYADDTALLTTGRSIQKCTENLQPALDQIEYWAKKWKVEMSPGKWLYFLHDGPCSE